MEREEFRDIASWVTKQDFSNHCSKVMFVLLDDNQDGRIVREDIHNVLLQWRHSRGFDRGAIQVSIGLKPIKL